MSIAVRADLVERQSTIDAKGQTESSIKSFGSGFTQVLSAPASVTLVPAAAAGTPDRLFSVCAIGGPAWVSKTNDATAEPRGIIHHEGVVPITLKAGEALKVALVVF